MKSRLFKKVLGIAAACALTAAAAPAMTALAEGTVTVGVTSFADTLEPTEQYFSWVITRYAVGETLTRFNEEAELQGCLAESWESSEDGLTWTFKIRDGVKFSNGDDLTAEAVKASLERTFEKSARASDSFFVPVSIEADGQNLIITTEKAIAGVPGCLADPLFLIMDVAAEPENIQMDGPICTGPYVFQEFVPDDH